MFSSGVMMALLLLARADAKTIACVGDSITFGSHSSNPSSFSYPAQLQTRLNVAHGAGSHSVTNFGVSGATAQRNGDKPYWNTHEYHLLQNRSWDIALVMLGTNDAKKQNWYLDENAGCENRDDSTCAFARDLTDLLESIRATVKLVGIPPPLTTNDNEYNMSQRVINLVFPKLIPNSVLLHNDDDDKSVVDVFSALGGTSSPPGFFPTNGCSRASQTRTPPPPRRDSEVGSCIYYCSEQSCNSCHPNDVGYARVAETFGVSLERAGVVAVGSEKKEAVRQNALAKSATCVAGFPL